MTEEQFKELMSEIKSMKEGIISKLEEIRLGIIDVESEVRWLREDNN